jgi:polysaccharide chain length determinant protein (PEP-CTERM system associated)
MSIFDRSSENNELRKLIDLGMHHALGVWRRRWLVVGVVWVVALAGWLYVYKMPNVYGASTVVYVDTETVLRPLLRGLSVESDVMNEVTVMTRAIVSRPNLEAVARQIDLDVMSNSPAEYERRLASLENRISIARDRQGVFTITFKDTSRDTALVVVRSLLDTFVEDTLLNKGEDTVQAEQTLRAQIDDYERRLIQAEERLKNFKRDNVGMMPGERGDYYQQLQGALSERDAVERQLRIEEQRLIALQRQVAGEEPVFGIMTPVMGGGRGSSLDGRIAELEQRLSNLAIEYTDRHPEVVRTRSLLDDLLAQRQAEIATRGPAASGPVASSPLDLNPVYQNLKIQVGNAQVELASIRANLQEKEAEVTRLRNLVDVIPEIEAELTRLNRDYDVIRNRHQEMLVRWENLQTSQHVRTTSDNIRFRVLEPPFAPTNPTGPPRGLFAVAAFIFALGAGVGAAVLLNLLRPVFFRASELFDSGLPVLGSVGQVLTPAERRQHVLSYAAFAACTAGLVVALVLVAAFADGASELVRRFV